MTADPYPGPRPFEREHEKRFFGRRAERSDLLSFALTHPTVLLYAESGAGKTSLLNVGLCVDLENEGCEVLGPLRIGADLPADRPDRTVKNVFTFNTLRSLGAAPEPGNDAQTIGKYLAGRARKPSNGGPSGPRVLIFDQFEEIFTRHTRRWQDRKGFFEDLGKAVEQDRSLRVVLALREEYLASLDPYAVALPGALRARFRLECLRDTAALEAIRKPLDGTGKTFNSAAAALLVKELLRIPGAGTASAMADRTGEFVDPLQLQVVCQDLWQSLPSGAAEIGEQNVKDLGNVDDSLSRYYEASIRKVVTATKMGEATLRRWFEEELITPAGTRGTVYQTADTTGTLPNAVVREIEACYLVRSEPRGGISWFELAHDRFIGPILTANRRWNERRRDSGSRWEPRAATYQRDPRPENLLTGVEISAVKEWLASPEARELGTSPELRKLLEASQSAQDRASTRRLRRLTGVLIGALVVMAAATVMTVRADRARVNAERARANAEATTEKARRDAADRATFAERVRLAVKLRTQPGNEIDALVLALRGTVPLLRAGEPPSEQDVSTVRALLEDVKGARWIRDGLAGALRYEFSPDGSLLMSASRSQVRAWSASDCRRVFDWESGEGDIADAYFTEGGRYIKVQQLIRSTASDLFHRQWAVINLEGKEERNIPGVGRARFVSFSVSGGRVLLRGSDRYEVIDTSRSPPTTVFSNDAAADSVELSPDGTRLVVSTRNSKALWNVDGQGEHPVREIADGAPGVAFAPNGKTFVVYGGSRGGVVVRDANTGKLIDHVAVRRNIVNLTFSGGGESVFVWWRDADDNLFVTTKQVGGPQTEQECPTNAPLFTFDDTVVYTEIGERTGSLYVQSWNARTGATRELTPPLPAATRVAAVTPDLRRVLTVNPQSVRIWSTTGPAPEKIDARGFDDLHRLACERLRSEPEMKDLRAEHVCDAP